MTIETSRRGLLTGLGCLIAAPAIVRASNLMPVRNRLAPELDFVPAVRWVIGSRSPNYVFDISSRAGDIRVGDRITVSGKSFVVTTIADGTDFVQVVTGDA